MDAVEWSDYLCPWCYLGLDRIDLLGELGVSVTCLPFELHPEIPPGGRPVHLGGRLARHLERVGRECAAVGLPFRLPERVPNTRLALSAAEWVRRCAPTAFPALHRALFRAHFADGLDIGDQGVLDRLVAEAGGDLTEVRSGMAGGEAARAVDESVRRARDAGVTGTPAWLLGDLLIPGVQPRETMRRWVTRIQARAGG